MRGVFARRGLRLGLLPLLAFLAPPLGALTGVSSSVAGAVTGWAGDGATVAAGAGAGEGEGEPIDDHSALPDARGAVRAICVPGIEEWTRKKQDDLVDAVKHHGAKGLAWLRANTDGALESPIAKFLEKRGPGIHHICLGSDDIASDDAALETNGMTRLREVPSPGAGGATVQFVHPKSTGGVLVELSQPPAGGHGH